MRTQGRFRLATTISTLALLTISVPAFAQSRRPMDAEVYETWQRIQERRISDDGTWISYTTSPMEGDGTLHVHSVETEAHYAFDRGSSARFSPDSRFLVFTIEPEYEIARQGRIDELDSDEMPKDSLGILDLRDGAVRKVARVKSFRMPEEGPAWLAYRLEDEPPTDEESGTEPEVEPNEGAGEDDDEQREKDEGTTLVVFYLDTGEEVSFDLVDAYVFAENGTRLAYSVSSKYGESDGVYTLSSGGDSHVVVEGAGHYRSLAFSENGERLAFLTDRDQYITEDDPAWALYYWSGGDSRAIAVASEGDEGIPDGWWVSENEGVSFSADATRLFFGTAPRPAQEAEDETPEWERIELDVWHWQDPLLQPNQLVQRENELNRAYTAAVHLDDGRIVQLARTDMPTVDVGQDGNAPTAVARTNMPYRQEISWDSPGYSDVYLVDVATGERRLVLERVQSTVRMSPAGRFLYWWARADSAWYAMEVSGGDPVDLTGGIEFPFYYELHDSPSLPSSYGSAGWTPGDRRFLVYDRFDIWAVDPAGLESPRNITEGVGRENNLRLRYVRLDAEADSIPENEDMLLSAFDHSTRASGFYRDRVRGDRRPSLLVMEDRRFGTPARARDADVLMFTRESFVEFPDVHSADLGFRNIRRHSDANPQQADYLWGSVELVSWRATDGRPHEGLLFKPENFDPDTQYPMMVYFYDKNSDGLHAHRPPFAHRSVINPTYYASRGYVVFIPDVHYQVGYPGESALNSVVSGTLSIVERGFVDPERIGVQGHSWGGYQIAYMVTRTNIFAAAEAGAPVANMTSAYGGIRWDTGLSRMFQYERTQSRLGGTLWEMRPRYIENSPLFWLDRVETPLLIMHNDHDGHVPWYQGIELFVALRRLGKPAWLINYNNERHWPTTEWKRRDWQRRLQGYFDHYLMGEPAPRWLSEGIPAVNKGRDLGF